VTPDGSRVHVRVGLGAYWGRMIAQTAIGRSRRRLCRL